MARVKGGYTTRRRRKRVLKLAKGYYGAKHALYRTAHEQVMRSLQYAYRDRKVRKRDFRKLWIVRINAACRENDITYSAFINGLKQKDIVLNRKMLAELAVNDAKAFADLVAKAKDGLAHPKAKEEVLTVFVKQAPKAERQQNHNAYVAANKKTEKAEAKVEKKAEAKPEVKKEVKAETKPAAKAEVKTEKPAPKKATKASVDYDAMKLADLKALCKEKGLKGYSTLKKAEIIELLKKA